MASKTTASSPPQAKSPTRKESEPKEEQQRRRPVEAEDEIAFVQTEMVPMTQGQGTIVEHDDTYDTQNSSSYNSEGGSSTTSVSSSVFCFTYANGRRYHADRFRHADYFMPNDENEQERLDLYHHIFLSLLGGKLYTAPLDKPQWVLDVGTGTGIWAIDFADENPQAKVIGTDISPIQPSWVPPNLTFEIDDMEEEWNHPDNHFDYIHMRSLSGCFRNWDDVLAQAYKKIAPGGYFEFQDYGCEMFISDGTMLEGECPDHPLGSYAYYTIGAAERAGRPLRLARGMKDRLEKAGFVDVVERTAIWPLGPWPKDKHLKELGKWGKMGMLDSLYPFGVQLLSREGWSMERITQLIESVKDGYDKQKYYTHGWFVYGRKPEVSS